MPKLADLLPAGSPIEAYLEAVSSIHRQVLGDGLAALYLHGSLVQGDFHSALSDLDVLGVVSGEIGSTQRSELAERLSHEALFVPAVGLELILCSLSAVKSPIAAMRYEFALSTGLEWGVQIETGGVASDILINMQLCRQVAIPLAGPPAQEMLSPVNHEALRHALKEELKWHRRDLKNAKPGPATVNAILNAARSLYAAHTGEVISKTKGATRWLEQHPEDNVVARALAYRQGEVGTAPSIRSAVTFVEKVKAEI